MSAIVLFDGVCHLCHSTVQFILLRDRQAYFQFAALQSETGQRLLREQGLEGKGLDSVVLIENGKAHTHSGAALRIVRRLPGAWKLLYGFIIIPPFIRNFVYNWIARNRYRWFGKEESCMMMQKEWKERFLE